MPELRFHLQTENSGLRYPLDSWANRSSSPVPTFTLAHSVRYLGRLLTRRCPHHGACDSLEAKSPEDFL